MVGFPVRRFVCFWHVQNSMLAVLSKSCNNYNQKAMIYHIDRIQSNLWSPRENLCFDNFSFFGRESLVRCNNVRKHDSLFFFITLKLTLTVNGCTSSIIYITSNLGEQKRNMKILWKTVYTESSLANDLCTVNMLLVPGTALSPPLTSCGVIDVWRDRSLRARRSTALSFIAHFKALAMAFLKLGLNMRYRTTL